MIILRENSFGQYEGKSPTVGDVVKLRTYSGSWELGECVEVEGEAVRIELQDSTVKPIILKLDTK